MIKGLFTWSGGPRSSGVGFFCFHALWDTKQKKPTRLDRGPPLHVNRVLIPAITKVERHISDRFCAILWYFVRTLRGAIESVRIKRVPQKQVLTVVERLIFTFTANGKFKLRISQN